MNKKDFAEIIIDIMYKHEILALIWDIDGYFSLQSTFSVFIEIISIGVGLQKLQL